MSEVLQFRLREVARFGSCPECGSRSGILNVGKAHWLYCETHATKWHGGFGLLPCLVGESASNWLANAGTLQRFREVVPLPWRWQAPECDARSPVSES